MATPWRLQPVVRAWAVRYIHAMVSPTASLVAVVEDDQTVRSTVGAALERAGYRVALYTDGGQAWEAFTLALPDLVVLDIIMPRVDGLELCRRLRTRSESLPIVFLSSRDEELDRVLGLELGADDYLCKPFSLRELVARVRVLFRRAAVLAAPTEAAQILTTGELSLDLDRMIARWRGEPVRLSVTELRLLEALARRPGHVKSRQQLLAAAYPDDAFVTDRAVDTHIKRLRRKLEGVDPQFAAIETIHGLGYRWRGASE